MPLTRRELLQTVAASIGALGVSGSGPSHLIPFISQPNNIVPGISTWYATSCRECPAGCGMVLRNREARVVKCEGNPEHPINMGALCARGQAALHGLYDPDRTNGPQRRVDGVGFTQANWEQALQAVSSALAAAGGRVALITDLQTGALDVLMREWLGVLGSDRLLVYEPINYERVRDASGGIVPSFNIAASDYLISFSADFLETWISPVQYAVQFAAMREVTNGTRGRFVYVGPRISMTAANADERIIVPPGSEWMVAAAIASEIAAGEPAPGEVTPEAAAGVLGVDAAQIRRIAAGLAEAGSPLALPGGEEQTARAAMGLNEVLGSGLVDTGRPHALTNAAAGVETSAFLSAIENGEVDVLVICSANPVYSFPDSARIVSAIERAPLVVSLSSYMDETAAMADWVLPSNTPLESWGDYEPYPDVANLMQPTMGTHFDTRQAGDILMALAEAAGFDPDATFGTADFYRYLRLHWGVPVQVGEGPESVAPAWESLLQRGGRWPGVEEIEDATPATGYQRLPGRGTMVSAVEIPASPSGASVAMAQPERGEVRLHAYPHAYYYDGRGANRWWLQEMPEPVTGTVWGSCAEIHPSTAELYGLRTDDVLEIAHGETAIEVPLYVWNGVAPGTVAVPIGQGHRHYGRFAGGTGANIFPLLAVENPVVSIRRTGRRAFASRTLGSEDERDRHLAQTTRLGRPVEREAIDLPLPEGFKEHDFYPGHEHRLHRWAMVVDLDRCIGCGACVTACYAENNVAVVGPDEIRRRREMSWLRIDRYVDWRRQSAPILFQPVLCQHCDSAPCEPVCPVFAAVHSEDGINEQVYSRCVGTRYCSNNCPWKVRRFNWFDHKWPEPMQYQLNPDVNVRSRGVMEKCTFCVQRLRAARIVARREGRRIEDGEVVPACAQTCPTGVFTFGDLMDENSRVSRIIREDPRAYQMLHELNTKPAVIYLKRVVEG